MMRTVSCIVIDDEPLALQLVASYVGKTPFLELKGTFSNASSAYSFLQREKVDLLFCDIQMPNLSGMELSKMLPEGTRIIFTTAFSQYAIEGFKVHALDYLLKPVSYDDFLAAAKHAYSVIVPAGGSTGSPTGISTVPEPGRREQDSIFVKSDYKLLKVAFDDITYIEGLKDYVKIHLGNGSDPVLSLIRMKSLEEQLPASSFVRVHRSFIVRTAAIEAIERNHLILGKDRIPIGETYQEALYKALSGSSLLPSE